MRRIDVYVKNPPSFRVEDGMAHIQFISGEVAYEFVMSMHNFKRGSVDAAKLYAMWAATKCEVIPFEAIKGDHAATP